MASAGKRKCTVPICELDKQAIANLITNNSDKVTYQELSSGSKYKDSFKRVVVESLPSKYVTCTTCNDRKLLQYHGLHGSNGVKGHLESHEKNIKPKESITPFMLKSCSASDKKKVTMAAVKLCAYDLRPFTIIEGEGMIQFVNTVIQLAATKGRLNAKD